MSDYPRRVGGWPSDPVPPKSRLPLILGLLGGGFALVVLACGGLAFWFFQGLTAEIPPAQASAEALLSDLRANRIEAAYAQTSQGFKARTTEEQFRGFVKAFPTLTTHKSATLTLQGMQRSTKGTFGVFVATLSGPNPSTCRITLTKEGDLWVVQGLNVP